MKTTKPYFDPVNSQVDFAKMEEEILARWYKDGIVEDYLNKNKDSKKYFSFLDGPITANNPMGVHHAWGRTYKDLWQRFYNMLGYRQRFQNGFDCQGLWVEVEVEKELGLKNKKEIENLIPGDKKASIDKFVQLCKDRVKKYSDIQTEQSKRLGYFMDWDHSYYTLSEDNNYMIWHFLKKCHEKGLIYKGNDVVPWCPRCETAISEHEILTEDYKEVTHESIYLRFPIEGKENEYLLVWTTTPWTVPANISVSLDAGLDYSLVEYEGKKYWLAKKLVTAVFGKEAKTLKVVKGKELEGFKYSGAFDNLPAISEVKDAKGFHEVVITDPMIMPISEEEGTGLVHTSTGTGAEDHKLGKKLGLPVVAAIEDDARYLPGFGFLAGKNAKSHPEIIFDYLKTHAEGNFIYKTENYTHRYPACWRCKKELVWKLADEWYIAIDPVREDMKRVTKNIKWLPSFGLKRELDWLENMHDWLISKKNRYWGLALPIWVCTKCGNFEIMGSLGELKKRAVEGWSQFEGHTPHKPWIDGVKIRCSKCGEVSDRIADVGNPWLDAGIVSFSTISENNTSEPMYHKDKKEWEKWFPADFITESFPGQFKNWFYSLIAMSTVLEGKEPAKTVLGFATLFAEDGRPMHKSWGNAIEFNEGAAKIGVDVMRWMFVRQNPADNILFGYKIGNEVRRQFHLKLWNVYNYFVTYATVDNWTPEKKVKFESKNILDKWLLSRFKETLDSVTENLTKYKPAEASFAIENFVDDLSNWYIRRSRERTGVTADSAEDKENFYRNTYFVLLNLSKLLAVFTPFISEKIYINLTKGRSVHLTDWPEFESTVDKDLISKMASIREIVEKVHAQRKDKAIPVRQPLASFKTNSKNPGTDLEELIKDEVNIKEIHWNSLKGSGIKVSLDTKITPLLEDEAKTRELIRMIQAKRKEMGIGLAQSIRVKNPWLPKSKDLIQKLKKVTLSGSIVNGDFEVTVIS